MFYVFVVDITYFLEQAKAEQTQAVAHCLAICECFYTFKL